MKKILSVALVACLFFCLAACGGVNLDRTISLSNGFTVEVSSSWKQVETGPSSGEQYTFEIDSGELYISFFEGSSDPYESYDFYVELVENNEYLSNIKEIPPVESGIIDGATILISERTYTHSRLGDCIEKTAYIVRGGLMVTISYSSLKDDFKADIFDAIIKSIQWK